MKYRTLGRSNLSVSVIALGCEGFSGKTAEEVKNDFDFAEKLGINFFDCYSPNPQVRSNFGAALYGRRNKFIIQGHLCSVWENNQYLRTRDLKKTQYSFEDLLQRLNTDYIEIGMIHYIDAEKDFENVFRDGNSIINYALDLKKQGKIRNIGISTHNPMIGLKAVKTGLIDVILFSVNPCYDMQPAGENVDDLWADESYQHALHNIDPEREKFYEICERENVGIDVMKVYGGGDLLNPDDSPFGRAFTPVQCLEYALTRPAVAAVMVGCKNRNEIKSAADWCTAPKEKKDYTEVMQNMDLFSWHGKCMYCGHCAPCPKGIDVASVNKFLNLVKTEHQIPETVRDHYKLLAHHASECIGCGSCEKRCPFGVAVIEKMKTAVRTFGF
jgi:predicted aldo/keto reductase-like oxidoreductase